MALFLRGCIKLKSQYINRNVSWCKCTDKILQTQTFKHILKHFDTYLRILYTFSSFFHISVHIITSWYTLVHLVHFDTLPYWGASPVILFLFNRWNDSFFAFLHPRAAYVIIFFVYLQLVINIYSIENDRYEKNLFIHLFRPQPDDWLGSSRSQIWWR